MTQAGAGRDIAVAAAHYAAHAAGTAAPPPSPQDQDAAAAAAPACVASDGAADGENDVDEEELEVTTAEFEVELADGQTWAMNFYECAAEGDLECLEEILDSGKVGVNDVDVDGFTALMVAAAEGHSAVVRTLLAYGADVTIRTHELRSTALHFAAKVDNASPLSFNCGLERLNGDVEIVEALCEEDAACVDCWNINADTPLIWACIEGRTKAVRVLLAHGADVNVLNQYGASTLLCAVMIGEDPEQDAESDTRRAEILTLLLETNGSLVNFQDREGSTAMHLAASCGYLACVKTLLAFGADITLRNAIGQTPLEEAQSSELRESGACVEHLRGIWRQLEEEAAARMMAMLEMEEEAGKSALGSNTGAGSSGKRHKKKSKKAKRKAKQQQQQQQQQEQEQEQERQLSAPAAATEVKATDADSKRPPLREDEVESAGSAASSDEDEEAMTRDSMSDSRKLNEEEPEAVEATTVEPRTALKAEDEPSAPVIGTPATLGAWTTVGKKQRSALAAITNAPSEAISRNSSATSRSASARHQPAAVSPGKDDAARRILTQRPTASQERSGKYGRSLASSSKEEAGPTHTATRPQEERWEETSSFLATARTARSLLPLSLLNPHAAAFQSSSQPVGSTIPSSSTSSLGAKDLAFASASPWRPGFSLATPATSSLSSAQHYSSAGRLTWKQQQRVGGSHQLAREVRQRWVKKLRLGNENVAETLGYLACGLCGELVNDNLQCSGGGATATGQKTVACTQLYCASCLQSSAFRTADAKTFECVKCHETIAMASMTSNSLAQAQAAALGLSMSTTTANGAQDDAACYSLEEMQHLLELSESRAVAVDLHAFHLVPGTDLRASSNGQLEVLERAHQLALTQIVEQRLANARALERLQLEEWLKMQRDVLQFAPR